jgi:hypothetical protein
MRTLPEERVPLSPNASPLSSSSSSTSLVMKEPLADGLHGFFCPVTSPVGAGAEADEDPVVEVGPTPITHTFTHTCTHLHTHLHTHRHTPSHTFTNTCKTQVYGYERSSGLSFLWGLLAILTGGSVSLALPCFWSQRFWLRRPTVPSCLRM